MKTTEKTKVKEEEVKVKKELEIIEANFEDDVFDDNETSQGNYDAVFYVRLKTKDAAYFQYTQVIGNVKKVDPRTDKQTLSGKVEKIELGSYTYDKKEIKTLKISVSSVKEDKETKETKKYLRILSLSYTQSTRSIINSLLGAKTALDTISISVYLNQNGYASIKMLINGKKAEWKYSIAEQKQYVEVITNKKGEYVSTDYDEYDTLLEDELRNHLSVLLPEQQHLKFVEETFGPDDEETSAEDFLKDDESIDDFLELSERK